MINIFPSSPEVDLPVWLIVTGSVIGIAGGAILLHLILRVLR